MGNYVIEGPVGADVSVTDTTAKYNLGARVVTVDTTTEGKNRVWRYVKHHKALAVGDVSYIGSTYELLYAAAAATAIGAMAASPLGIPQAAVSSGTSALYSWVQTSGFFDSIDVIHASAGTALYPSTTAGSLTSNSSHSLPVVGLSLRNSTGTESGTKEGFAINEIFVLPFRTGTF